MIRQKDLHSENLCDELCGIALTYSYISSAQCVRTSVFCAKSSNSVNMLSSVGSLSLSSSPPRKTITCCLRGDEEELCDGRGADEPKSFFEARLRARVRAFEAARDAVLVGDEESGGACR